MISPYRADAPEQSFIIPRDMQESPPAGFGRAGPTLRIPVQLGKRVVLTVASWDPKVAADVCALWLVSSVGLVGLVIGPQAWPSTTAVKPRQPRVWPFWARAYIDLHARRSMPGEVLAVPLKVIDPEAIRDFHLCPPEQHPVWKQELTRQRHAALQLEALQ